MVILLGGAAPQNDFETLLPLPQQVKLTWSCWELLGSCLKLLLEPSIPNLRRHLCRSLVIVVQASRQKKFDLFHVISAI